MNFRGKLVIFSGPSGAGKTSIVKTLLNKYPELFGFSISATTRSMRANEVNGKDYYFIPVDVFKEKIKNDEFIEWEEVYEGLFYGTLKSEVESWHALNRHILFDIDVKGGLNIKKKFPDITLSIFVMPPSIEDLEKRLNERKTENEETLKKRINKVQWEISMSSLFDIVVINNDLNAAIEKAEEAVVNFLKE